LLSEQLVLLSTRLFVSAALCCALSSCGFALQRASVSRSFQGRFGCLGARVQRVSDGYHVDGCGRSAEYVCFSEPDSAESSSSDTKPGAMLAGVLITAAFAGYGERCVLASSERTPPLVARAGPSHVGRVRERDGRELLKTRVLFAGGHLRLLAAPRDHPEHALLIVNSVARMHDAPCRSELFHDGVPVPIVQEAREGRYEARLVLPIAALAGAQDGVRFAGTVCGIGLDLDAAGRTTLGMFAAHFAEERARIAREVASEATVTAAREPLQVVTPALPKTTPLEPAPAASAP
jgi:hypothetical protein